MNTIRFTQLGKWTGEISTEAGSLNPKAIYGIRDRSWGVRPVGEPEGGAPGMLNQEPGVYWCWAPIHFNGFCTQFGTFQDKMEIPHKFLDINYLFMMTCPLHQMILK